MRALLLLAAASILGAGAATWWALESSGVAVIVTETPDGRKRSTHVWYATSAGEIWLEAGAPENSWFQDVRSKPRLSFSAVGRTQAFDAIPVGNPSGHDAIRGLLRRKYGLRDRWVGFIVDTSRSVAVRLVPPEQPAAAGEVVDPTAASPDARQSTGRSGPPW